MGELAVDRNQADGIQLRGNRIHMWIDDFVPRKNRQEDPQNDWFLETGHAIGFDEAMHHTLNDQSSVLMNLV